MSDDLDALRRKRLEELQKQNTPQTTDTENLKQQEELKKTTRSSKTSFSPIYIIRQSKTKIDQYTFG